ncbi:MAG TPA: hypothetical protein VIV57_25505 [Anaeromyxobacter sp.]
MAAGLFYHDVLAALSRAGVPFVVVGGLAVNLHGVPRFTADVDVAVAFEGGELARAAEVLERLGLRCRLPVSRIDLADADTVRSWIADRNLSAVTFADPDEPLREVDLVVASPIPFEEMARTAVQMSAAGVAFAVASIDALIRMKSGTGREQDASDVDALLRVQKAARGP